MKLNQFLTAALLGALLPLPAPAAPPELTREDLPRIKPTELKDVQKTFQVKKGFELQLAAAEPNVYSPIELCFDENGRMFVIEMRDYSEMREVKPHLGRIRMLEDKDGDGVYETSTVYADDLPWPTGLICYNGGIFVAATPDIIYFKDTDGDGKADIRKVIFTGYGAGKERLNVQALVNCLRWGLDNRIHGQTAGNGGLVHGTETANAVSLSLNGRDFYFDPRDNTMTAEAGGGQYGMSYDDHGHKFVCSNSRHIMTYMYDQRYAERNPFYTMPPGLVDIPVDGPAAEVFRTSPEEAWRVIRTKWRVSGIASGPVEGGGRASGYFTGATGITIYRGDAWPEDYRGDAFIADIGSNLIHHKKVRQQGVRLIAERAPDEQKVEFITSTDLWFRPAQMANAPDGCLYICDMYREVIEHPWSLPDSIKKLLDLNAGNDRGRIYRIAPEGLKPRRSPQLGKVDTATLVATLAVSNAWHRETASRLLFERQDKTAIPLLMKMQDSLTFPLARLHALHALDGLDALDESIVLKAMNDADPTVREHGIKLSEKFFADGVAPAAIWQRLQHLATDPAPTVRYQLAFTLGELKGNAKIAPLATIARTDVGSFWTEAAILSSLKEGAGEMFASLSSDRTFRTSTAGQDMLAHLITMVGAQNQPMELDRVLDYLDRLNESALVFSMTRALSDGLQRAKVPLTSLGKVTNIVTLAYGAARDTRLPEATRIPAIQLLSHMNYVEISPVLLALLDQRQTQPIQLATLGTLSKFSNPDVATELIRRWNSFTPRVRAEAISVLLARPERATALLQAIQAGTIQANALDSTQVKLLTTYRDPSVRVLAAKVLGAKPAGTRQQVIDKFMTAIDTAGDAVKGKKIYEERCISCHRSSGEGFALGPDLVTVKTTGKEKLLTNIIDPNREVRPEYVAYVAETGEEDSLVGLVVNETTASVTLRQAYGKETVIPRANITKMRSQGQSLMPEGLEANLSTQDMANLLEYISTATQ